MGTEKRMKMSLEDRAKQFLPFSAVRGLEEALQKKREALLFSDKPILAADGEKEIDSVLRTLKRGDKVEVEYYDGKGSVRVENYVKALLPEKATLLLETASILFDSILQIQKETE